VVSRSEAVIFNVSSLISKRKSSRIGSVLFELNTPPMDCKFLSNKLLDTMNFILFDISLINTMFC